MARRMEEHPEVLGLPVGSLEDKDLTLAFQSGEEGAYQAIHDRYADRVQRVCRRMLSNPQDAQEAAQESFLRIYQALGRFNGRYQLGAWITRIATNVCLDHLRARSRRPADFTPLDVVDLEEDRHQPVEGPEMMVIRNAESRRVRKVLAQLPPLHRAAIVLRDFEGLSYAEVAVALQLSECQVKALIHRARQNFKRSWVPLSLVMPWRLLDRFKAVDAGGREHVAQAVATGAQVAPACTNALQQCGQYLAERVAPILTATLVGAGLGGAAVAHAPRQDVPAETAVRSAKETPIRFSTKQSSARVQASGAAESKTDPAIREAEMPGDDVGDGESGEQQPMPSQTAAVDETPSSTETPAEQPAPSPSADPVDKGGTPAPAPFAPTMGFDWGRAVLAREPESAEATVDCASSVLEQRLVTHVEDRSGRLLSATLLLHWGTNSQTRDRISLELTVSTDSGDLYYSGTGGLVGGSHHGDDARYRFLGEYGTLSNAWSSADLPPGGDFSISLGLDCAAQSVVTESVVLST